MAQRITIGRKRPREEDSEDSEVEEEVESGESSERDENIKSAEVEEDAKSSEDEDDNSSKGLYGESSKGLYGESSKGLYSESSKGLYGKSSRGKYSASSKREEDVTSSDGEVVIQNGRKFLIRKANNMKLKFSVLDNKEESKPVEETSDCKPDETKQEESKQKSVLPRFRESKVQEMFYNEVVKKCIKYALVENSIVNNMMGDEEDNCTELSEDICKYISWHCYINLCQIINNGVSNMRSCNRTHFTVKDFLSGYNYYSSLVL